MGDFVPISLPSKCLTYSDVSPDSIKVRPLRGKDEKLIAEISGDTFERRLSTVLANVVEGVDVKRLTVGDRLYILIWEAINSYTENYGVDLVCDFCMQKVSINVDLSKLGIKELPDNYTEPYEIKLSDDKLVRVRLFTVQDELAIFDYEKKQGEDAWLYRFACSVVDDELNVMQKVDFLAELPAKDLARIRAFHEKFYHGPVMEAGYVCPLCKGEGLIPIPFRIEILFPYGKALTNYFGDAV